MFNYNPGVNDNAGSIIMQAQQNADNSIQQGVNQATQGISQAMQNYGILKARGDAATNQWEMVKNQIPGAITPEDDKRFYSGNLSTKEAMLSTSNTLLQHALTSAQQQQQINAQANASANLDVLKSQIPGRKELQPVVGGNGMYLLDNRTGDVKPMMSNGAQVPAPPRSNGLMDLLVNGGASPAAGGGVASQMPPAASPAAPGGSQLPGGTAAPSGITLPATPPAAAAIPTITSQAQFSSLPSGAYYKGANGGTFRKP